MKFNDFDTLLKSYNELEKQFTKKCQQLSQLRDSGTSNQAPQQPLPPQDKATFFAAHPRAKQFEQQIDQLVSSPKYSNESNSYQLSYIDCLEGETSSPSQPIDDAKLQQYIVGNKSLCDKVLQHIVSAQPLAPPTISGSGGNVSVPMTNKPQTLVEASRLARAMIDGK